MKSGVQLQYIHIKGDEMQFYCMMMVASVILMSAYEVIICWQSQLRRNKETFGLYIIQEDVVFSRRALITSNVNQVLSVALHSIITSYNIYLIYLPTIAFHIDTILILLRQRILSILNDHKISKLIGVLFILLIFRIGRYITVRWWSVPTWGVVFRFDKRINAKLVLYSRCRILKKVYITFITHEQS